MGHSRGIEAADRDGRGQTNSWKEVLVAAYDIRVDAESSGPEQLLHTIVNDVSLNLYAGQSIAIVGESGSGKSSLVQALFGFARPGLALSGGVVEVMGQTFQLSPLSDMSKLRGRTLSLVPQSANAMLNPILSIGQQMREVCRALGVPERRVKVGRVEELLGRVGLHDTESILQRYPHQLSGGQRQRVVLCMALLADPAVLVLDEATTGLDVITERRILELVRELQSELGFGLLAVSHDLSVLKQLCSELVVLYRGVVIERGPLKRIVESPAHPYTGLLVKRFTEGPTAVSDVALEPSNPIQSNPNVHECVYITRCGLAKAKCQTAPPLLPMAATDHLARCWFGQDVSSWLANASTDVSVPSDALSPGSREEETPPSSEFGRGREILAVSDLSAHYREPGFFSSSTIQALQSITFSIPEGEIVGIVGESGSGKTTLGRVLAGLHSASSGSASYEGASLGTPAARRPLWLRQQLQIIFQNPDQSLNPARTVGEILLRRIQLFESVKRESMKGRIDELLESVMLPRHYADRRPKSLSGGEKQRVAIARALIGGPRILICDEILSSLDVLIQFEVLRMLRELQERLGLTIIFISHDIVVTAAVADRILVFKDGELVDQGLATQIVKSSHPYTEELIETAFFLSNN